MVLHRRGIPAAGMGDVPLPVLLPVETFILNFPPLPSCSCQLFRILFGDPDARQLLEIRPPSLPFYHFLFPESQHVHRFPIIIDIVNEFCMTFLPFFRNLFIFLRNARNAACLITDYKIPAVIPADVHHWFRCIQTVRQQ
jgi:hypothetical protein